MKAKSILIVSLIVFSVSHGVSGQEPFDALWKQVDDYTKKRLPQSALEVTDQIHSLAKEQGDGKNLLKVLLYRNKLRADYQENFLEKSIAEISADLDDAGEPARQVMHSVLADLYWRYYLANRGVILDRTDLLKEYDDDFTTWGLDRLTEEVLLHYEASLRNEELLKTIPVRDYALILETEEGSEKYRPTIFDFLAHRAVDFYINEEKSVTRPAETFLIDDPDYFAPADAFVQLEIPLTDTMSFAYRAMVLFKELLSFHLNDKDPAALIDADLKRLSYVKNNYTGPGKDEHYTGTLTGMNGQYSGDPAGTMVSFELANYYVQLGEQYDPFQQKEYRWYLKDAREIILEAINEHPGSRGALNCKTLLPLIEKKEVGLTLSYANIPGSPFLASLEYRNISRVYLRFIRMDHEADRELRYKNRENDLLKEYLKLEPVKEYAFRLPNEGDFQSHVTEIGFDPMDPGYYVILASFSDDFEDVSATTYSNCWVTGLSYITKNSPGKLEIHTLGRDSGMPMGNVKIESFSRNYEYNTRSYRMILEGTTSSDEEGYAVLENTDKRSRSLYLRFSTPADTFTSENYFFLGPPARDQEPVERTWFFTDRAIYRPGQTVYFKGIMLESLTNDHKILSGKNTTVTLYDRNGKEIRSLRLVTNNYGSFQGSFTLPNNLLTGTLRISNNLGTVYINVEEYKRPNFKIAIKPLKGTYKLNEEVEVTGEAQTYSGSPVDHASVRYRVVRRAGFPFRDSWWYWPIPGGEESEITNGLTTTGDDGGFSFDFNAIPDPKVDQKYSPVFHYTIHVDVTDMTGETHTTEQTVTVGYQSLVIRAEVPDYLFIEEDRKVSVTVTNLNGEPVEAGVKATLRRLQGPDRILRERTWQRPDIFLMDRNDFIGKFPHDVYDNETDRTTWERTGIVFSGEMSAPQDSTVTLGVTDPAPYVLVLETTDPYGEPVKVEKYFTALSGEGNMPVKAASLIVPGKAKALPGQTVSIHAGTSYEDARILVEQKKEGQTISRKWISLGGEVTEIDFPVDESMRGGFACEVSWIRNNRSYQHVQQVAVPFSNKELDVTLETYRTELTPGGKEDWKIKVAGDDDEPAMTELLASMYDASLDAFTGHSWSFNLYSGTSQYRAWDFGSAFGLNSSNPFGYRSFRGTQPMQVQGYDRLNWFGFNYYSFSTAHREMFRGARMADLKIAEAGMAAKGEPQAEAMYDEEASEPGMEGEAGIPQEPETPEKEEAPGAPVRRNFEETAFFFPQLMTDEEGAAVISFTVPESLTEWNFKALAHDLDLRYGFLEESMVTKKEVMAVPNWPRFLRQGDRISFTVKIISLAEEERTGTATLEFVDAFSGSLLENFEFGERGFTVSKGGSAVVDWEFTVPENFDAITLRAKARAGTHTDGEEKTLPVLPNRMLVTETLPMPVRDASETGFRFEKVKEMNGSATLSPYRLTLEFTSNPAWYAVMALPYLMEPRHSSADAVFNKYYSNSLAAYIAGSDPRIKSVFDAWKQEGVESFYSKLEKNEELKNILLNVTPWVLEAESEREGMKRIALLFDENRMEYEKNDALQKLAEQQSSNGGWPWFRGMPESRYITQLIVTGIGKLHHLGVINLREEPRLAGMMNRALGYLDTRIREDYQELQKRHEESMDEDHLSSIAIHYLYARSFFKDLETGSRNAPEAAEYFMGQAEKYWHDAGKYEQGLIALVMHRHGKVEVAGNIVRSLKEHSLTDEEMGMYWRARPGYLWNEAPVETQALMIEVFEEVAGDSEAVEEMKIWLLKQKQTQAWETGRATAEAIYALLARGSDLLAGQEPVVVTVGRITIDPARMEDMHVQAGTGYFKTSWNGNEIRPAMGDITVEKKTPGIAWGAAYFQYYEDLDKIEMASSPLSVSKELFIEVNTPEGPALQEVTAGSPIKTGDRIVSRITISTDRDMEFVHLQDMRGATFEPVNPLSGYRYQGGIGYYESPKDASTDFFIQYLRKGSYIIEYPVFATQEGAFSNGITTIQCLYAPEFSAHSKGIRVTVE